MRLLTRSLQALGLVLPLLAIVLQIGEFIGLGEMLAMTLFGLAGFYIGRIVEGYTPD